MSGSDVTGADPWEDPPMLDGRSLASPEFALAWPVRLFVAEAETLARYNATGDRSLLLREAFVSDVPAGLQNQWDNGQWTYDQIGPEPLRFLWENRHLLRPAPAKRGYWRQRRQPEAPSGPTLVGEAFVRAFITTVNEFRDSGYFDPALRTPCEDDRGDPDDPSEILRRHLDWQPRWPLDASQLWPDRDNLFDIIEVLHDLAARPRSTSYHDFNDCGTHFHDPAPLIGQAIYRWRVNELLDQSDLGLRLADDGDDAGRLVTVTDEARTELLQAMVNRTDPVTGDLVRYAIHLFRKRDAADDDKRTAIEKLYQVLEPARKAGRFRSSPLTKADEDLFGIANRYAIRHGDGKAEQLRDYDSAYLDWLFWWYLATVELADRLSDQSGTTRS